MPHQVQRVRTDGAQVLCQCPSVGAGILRDRRVRKGHRVGLEVPCQSAPQQERFTAALPQSVHVDDDGLHRINPKLSDSMTARLVLEETISTASLPDAQRYCPCSASLKVTGRRRASLKEKACSRL